MPKFAIILAGGKGARFGNDMPKQFLPLLGKPLLFHSLNAFLRAQPGIDITLVLPQEHIASWESLRKTYRFNAKIRILAGGEERFHSVQNGLKSIVAKNGTVAIHDAARPLVSEELIKHCFAAAAEKGSAIPVIPVRESIRQLHSDGSHRIVDRTEFRLVQTPQCFSLTELKEAYNCEYSAAFTDDASVMEAAGFPLHLVQGEEDNIKMTYSSDLIFAEIILKSRLALHF